MDEHEQRLRDFCATWTDGLNAALHDTNVLLSGQEAYEIVWLAFGRIPSIEEFSVLSEDDFVKLRDAARDFLENSILEATHMKHGVEMAMRFWNGPNH